MKNKKLEMSIAAKIVLLLIIAILITLSFKLGKLVAEENNIITPKMPGVYIPITGERYAIVVLDMNNTYHRQLVDANQKAFAEINKLLKGGQQ